MSDAIADSVLAGGVVEGDWFKINSSALYSSDSQAVGQVSKERGKD